MGMIKEINDDKCVCSICGKVFNSERQLNGHMKVHKPEYEEQKRRQAENNKRKYELIRKQKEEEYNKNPKLCVVCGKPLSYKQAIIYKSTTCSNSCGVSKGNRSRDGMSEKGKISIANGMKNFWKSEEGQERLRKKLEHDKKFAKVYKVKTCPICGKKFVGTKRTCSSECGFQMISQKRIQKIIKDGTSNNSSRYVLTHDGIDYRCDSKLEIAGIIFMIENLGFQKIERFVSILNFKDNEGNTRRYNPDFICYDGENTTIVEVKQDVNKITCDETFANYRMFLNEKKEALQKFAEERDYRWLWLTPSFSIDFRKIYRSIISGKNSYTYKKLE